jgi:hypothetical protein
MIAARDKESKMLSDEFVSRYYETVAVMSAPTRLLFTKLELQVGYFSNQIFTPRRYQNVPSTAAPLQQILTLLPSLKSLVISFGVAPAQMMRSNTRITEQRNDTLLWLLEHIPQGVDILWDTSAASPAQSRIDESTLSEIMHNRGPPKQSESVAAQLEVKRREKNQQPFFFDRQKE